MFTISGVFYSITINIMNMQLNIIANYRKLHLLLTLVVGWISISCSCENFNSTRQEYDANEVVVVGKVLAVKPFYYLKDTSNAYKTFSSNITLMKNYQNIYLAYIHSEYTEWEFRDYTVQVDKKLKGKDLKDRIIIRTGVSDADCGYRFVKGQSYLIFASTRFWYLGDKKDSSQNESNVYMTSLCNFNENIKTAKETVKIYEKY
jgi:hypothetical protein